MSPYHNPSIEQSNETLCSFAQGRIGRSNEPIRTRYRLAVADPSTSHRRCSTARVATMAADAFHLTLP
jgi:hypothetical protein